MSRYAPQRNYFDIAEKLNKWESIIFIISFIFSLIFSIYLKDSNFSSIVSIILLVILTVLTFSTAYYQNKGDTIRRRDFIDNSFGTKLTIYSSVDYYTNSEVEFGMNKALINVFENLFFSLNIVKKMKNNSVIKMSIGLLILLLFATYGFANSLLALPILQLFLSKYFIEEFILLNNYVRELEILEQEIIDVLTIKEMNMVIREGRIMKILIGYECNISYSKIMLDSKIFNRMNDELSLKWNEIKIKYNI